jgi:hypothetical protein
VTKSPIVSTFLSIKVDFPITQDFLWLGHGIVELADKRVAAKKASRLKKRVKGDILFFLHRYALRLAGPSTFLLYRKTVPSRAG